MIKHVDVYLDAWWKCTDVKSIILLDPKEGPKIIVSLYHNI